MVYESRPIKKKRRSRAEIEALKEAMYEILNVYHPMTVRQLFYQMVGRDLIAKDEKEYKNVVVRLSGKMRKARELPFEWFADSTRWMRKPRTHDSLDAALFETVRNYRKSVWVDEPVYVEIWIEKEALAGVMYEVTAKWDVPLMPTRGYSSLSFLHGAAMEAEAQGKPAYLYYFGDYDPSGEDISRVVERELRELAPGVEIIFERVAVNPEQIAQWQLPTRPTKRTDSRSKKFSGRSVELDAVDPETLLSLVSNCITRHINEQRLIQLERVEAEERKVWNQWLQARGGG